MAERAETVERPGNTFQIVCAFDPFLHHQVLGQRARHGDHDADRLALRPETQGGTQPAIGDVDDIVHDRLHRGDAAMNGCPGDVESFFFPQTKMGRCRAGEIVNAESRSGTGREPDGQVAHGATIVSR